MLKPDKTRMENGVLVNEKIIPWGAKWVKNSGKYKKGDKYKADRYLTDKKVGGITFHNTPGDANAETHTRATYPNQNMNDARVHYYVDDKEAWQNLLDIEVGWHAGDGSGKGNSTTISIEIIEEGKAVKDYTKSEKNGIRLGAALMVKHNLTMKDIYKHQDWSGKYCPRKIIPRWGEFLKELETEYLRLKKSGEVYRQGHKGEGVKQIQQDLIKLGFPVGKHGADGSFGPDTTEAVIAFQNHHKLEVDGIAGPATQEKIKDLLNPKQSVENKGYYRVVVGSYQNKSLAEVQQRKLKDVGFDSFLLYYEP